MSLKRFIAISLSLILAFGASSCGKKTTDTKKTDSNKTTEATSNTYNTTLTAISEVNVYSDATGLVVECNADEGDYVEAGALLYKLDDTDVLNNIASARNAIAKSQVSINSAQDAVNKLSIYAPASGVLKNFSVKKGERVNSTTIGYVADESSFVARVPFTEAQLASIRVGSTATVTAGELMGSVSGKVTRIYAEINNSVPGSAMRDAEIQGRNVGGLTEGLIVSATVNGMTSPISGYIEAASTSAVVSKGSGNATAVYAKEGDYVKSGQLLVKLENESTTATLSRAKLDKQDNERKLNTYLQDQNDLYIYAPISGIVTTRKKGERDSIASKSDSVMVISDASRLTSTFSVSDDDYKKLKKDDTIIIKCDGYDTIEATITDKDKDTNSITIELDNTYSIPLNTIATITIE